MKFNVDNEEVFASTGGRPFDKSKPLIIFVHGSGLTHMCWVLQTRYFAFHGYSVLALDLPGHGLSKGKSLKSIEEMGQNGLEEERRLAYVGITRAKKKVIISFSMNRFYQGDWIDSMASRFIDELPEKYLEKNSFFDEDKE